MTIEKKTDAGTLTLTLTGRLDTITAPQLDEEIKAIPGDVEKLILDFQRLDYVSSAGLRVLLSAQKQMKKRGGMVLRGVQEAVREVLDITGFSDILTIE